MENSNSSIVVEAQMLIRKPIAQVFEAFVNPEITTKFWFTKSSGRLALGKKVRWDWEIVTSARGILRSARAGKLLTNQLWKARSCIASDELSRQ